MFPLALPSGPSASLATIPGALPALPPPPPGSGGPRVAAASAPGDGPRYDQTHLKLTSEQQERLREYVKTRIVELRRDMGLDYSDARPAGMSLASMSMGSSRYSSNFGATTDSWAWKREMNQKLYDCV